jgi:hypothetical protein
MPARHVAAPDRETGGRSIRDRRFEMAEREAVAEERNAP